MTGIQFDRTSFYENGRKVYVNSGEFHYFRVPKADWERRMRLYKEAGGNTIATYVPWLLHEPEEGKFHIDCGDGYSDITEFLETAKKVGLYVIARPGPYQYSELNYDGLPGWLVKNYPEIRAKRKDGSDIATSSVSYCHPLFLEKAYKYFEKIVPILAKYTAPKGGPIVMVQPDNEITGKHVWSGSIDFNETTMGIGKENGRYPRFLQKRFGTVEKANEVLGTDHKAWIEFTLADGKADGAPELYYRWYHNYYDFYLDQIADYFEILVKMFRDLGIDVPFCHNPANPYMNAMLEETKRRLGDSITLGSDHYYTLMQTWPHNSPSPQHAIFCWGSVEQLRLLGCPPAVFELPLGSLADWPPISREDLLAHLMMHQAFGLRGHNGYVFTGGTEPPGASDRQITYDYVAPISATGEIRPHYYALKDFGDWTKAHPEVLEDSAVPDFQVMLDWNMARDIYCPIDPKIKGSFKPGSLWEEFRIGFMTSAFAGAMQPEYVLPGQFKLDSPLVVPCSGFLSREKQEAILDFLKRGGKVLCVPCLPRFDESGMPCTVLTDALGGISNSEAEKREASAFESAGLEKVWLMKTFNADNVPADAEVIAKEIYSGDVIGWTKKVFDHDGQFMYLGASWTHAKREQSELLNRLLALLGMKRHHTCDDDWVLTYLRKDPSGLKLYALNLSTGKRKINLTWRPDETSAFRTIPEAELNAMEVRVFELK